MKFLNKLAIFGLGIAALTSCVDKEADYQVFPDPDVDFSFAVDGDEYTLDYYVVSHIQFNNKSAKTGTYTWDFGDGTTSNEVSPLHKYTKAGLYTVKLTVDGAGYKEQKILIIDITPTLSVDEQSTDVITINDTEVSFKLALPNPENLRCRYEWTFPEGTKDATVQSSIPATLLSATSVHRRSKSKPTLTSMVKTVVWKMPTSTFRLVHPLKVPLSTTLKKMVTSRL